MTIKRKGGIEISGPGKGSVGFEISWKGGKRVDIPPIPDIESVKVEAIPSSHDADYIDAALKRTGTKRVR